MELSWSERMKKSGHGLLPNLGFGGSLVAIFVSSFFAGDFANRLLVIIIYGPHEFFINGLRVINWKDGVLSTGAKLGGGSNLLLGLLTLLFWICLIGITEFVAGILISFLARRASWVSMIFRFVGGAMLILFAVWFCQRGSPAVHPIPLAAFIGGAVLIWKAATSTRKRRGI